MDPNSLFSNFVFSLLPFDAVCALYWHSSVSCCCIMVCAIRDLLAAGLYVCLLLQTSQLWLFTRCLCSLAHSFDIVHNCCNVSLLLSRFYIIYAGTLHVESHSYCFFFFMDQNWCYCSIHWPGEVSR